MKIIKKNVYYCDFCKKKGLSAGAMSKHEKGCTANINRKCRMCNELGTGYYDIPKIVNDFKARFKVSDILLKYGGTEPEVDWIGKPITLEEIQDSVDNCPMCVLTIMRNAKLNTHHFEWYRKYDYKKELEKMWYEVNKQREEESYKYSVY